jgi:hypothetical protein
MKCGMAAATRVVADARVQTAHLLPGRTCMGLVTMRAWAPGMASGRGDNEVSRVSFRDVMTNTLRGVNIVMAWAVLVGLVALMV